MAAVRSRIWVAYGAFALAVAFLVPSMAPLSGSMDAFAADLANGTFRPFGPPGGRGVAFSSSLGGLTGYSDGGYVPGMTLLPDAWSMDRDGRPGEVTVDYVFDPALGAMKRLKAYDRVAPDGQTIQVGDTRLRPVLPEPRVAYDVVFHGRFDVRLRAGEPVPIFSPHPQAIVDRAVTEGGLPVRILKDGADTYYAIGTRDETVTLNITYRAGSAYYAMPAARGFRTSDYPADVRPSLPPQLVEDARVILARAGVADPTDVIGTLSALNAYFRAFEEGDIPPPSEIESLYLALAAGGKGCCRHRAFAYMVTAHAVGIPTRVVVNEAHAFVEVMLPQGQWHQVNLGGCGSYRVNNPNDHRPLFAQSADPRAEADPDLGRSTAEAPAQTEITESPERILKGERYFVNGTVVGADGRAVAFARIDVFLNETKEAPGRLTGAGTTGPDGRFAVEARVPRELPAKSYQLVARATDGRNGTIRYAESWSDPPVDVFSPTRFVLDPVTAAVGVPAPVRGRLLDIDGQPVREAVVRWSVDGAPQPPVRTDRTGFFVVNATFQETGQRAVQVRFDGDEHHGASEGAVAAYVALAAIVLPPEPFTLARGEPGVVRGLVAAAGGPVADVDVHVSHEGFRASGGPARAAPADPLVARTDAAGRFEVVVQPHASTPPGIYEIRLEVPSRDLFVSAPVRVAIAPRLVVETPAAVREARPWVVEAHVLDDQGEPLPGALVEMSFDGNGSTTRVLLTNRTGVARFEVAPRALAAGKHDLLVAYAGDADHLAAQERLVVEVTPPLWASIPLAAWLAAAAAAAVVLAAWRLLRPGGIIRTRLAARAAAWRRRVRLHVAFPDHPAGVAPAFEPGERLRLEIRAFDRHDRPVRAKVLARVADGRARGRARPTRPARLELPLGSRPHVARLEVRARGLARLWTPPVLLDVPVTSYRHAVERVFVDLRARARLASSATPQEVVTGLVARVRADDHTAVEASARLFEIADYSQHVVDRAFYHAFATAAARVLHALEAEETHAA